jgi:hypothetical protein
MQTKIRLNTTNTTMTTSRTSPLHAKNLQTRIQKPIFYQIIQTNQAAKATVATVAIEATVAIDKDQIVHKDLLNKVGI